MASHTYYPVLTARAAASALLAAAQSLGLGSESVVVRSGNGFEVPDAVWAASGLREANDTDSGDDGPTLPTYDWLFNRRADNLARWRRAWAMQKAGLRKARSTVQGDSTAYGFAATPDPARGSMPTLLRNKFAAATGTVLPDTGVVPSWYDAIYDGTALTQAGAPPGQGGYGIINALALGSAAQSITFPVPAGCSRVDLSFLRWDVAGPAAKADVIIDGATVGQVDAYAAGTSYGIKSYPVSPATAHTFKVQGIAGNIFFPTAFDAVSAGKHGVVVDRLGASSFGAASFAADTFGEGGPLRQVAYTTASTDLTVVQLGINDGGDPPRKLRENIKAIANRQRDTNGGDVLLMTPYPVSRALDPIRTNSGGAYGYPDFVDALYEAAIALDVPLVDLSKRWHFDYATGTSDFTNVVHPGDGGYPDGAQAVIDAVVTGTVPA